MNYRQLLTDLQTCLTQARAVQTETLWLLAAATLILGVLSYLALGGRVPVWSPPLPAPVAVMLARRYRKNRSSWSRLSRLETFYQRGLERIENRFAGRGYTGEEFQPAGHPFSADLNLFGTGSLFELLCTTRTQIGRQRLAGYLLEMPGTSEAKARQQAVQELSGQTKLREEIALLGKFEFRESTNKTFADWLKAPVAPPSAMIRILALASSAVLLALMAWTYFAMPIALASFLKTGPWILALIAVNALIAARCRRPLDTTKRMGMEVGILREGIALLQKQTFESPKLGAIQKDLGQAALPQLERITRWLEICDNPFFDLFASLLIVRTQLSFAVERWRFQYGESLHRWLHAWAEFEALSAIAGYTYENPANQFPEFIDGEPTLEAHALGHPIIPEATCVRNDVSFGGRHQFYVISGSNMAGKSTLLRAIGLNLALAGAGAPVRAKSLKLSHLAVCASIGITDSLREGKSKFLAEITKLRQTIDSARQQSTLFLIDEILAGTNSRDRRIAAESVVRTLLHHGAVGLLSTHDLGLTEIADMEGLRGANVHMEGYLLKPGIIQQSNALAIAKMAGVMPTDR